MSRKEKCDAIVEQMGKYSWDDNENDNQAALTLLNSFCREYKFIKPTRRTPKYCYNLDYLSRLLLIRQALHKKEYGVACEELYTIAHLFGLFNVRIYAVVKSLLEEYFD